jgi:hypothetical protein
MLPTIEREAGRVVVLDPAHRVLLLQYIRVSGERDWATPGGGLQDGEDFECAARGELAEEVGMSAARLSFMWGARPGSTPAGAASASVSSTPSCASTPPRRPVLYDARLSGLSTRVLGFGRPGRGRRDLSPILLGLVLLAIAYLGLGCDSPETCAPPTASVGSVGTLGDRPLDACARSPALCNLKLWSEGPFADDVIDVVFVGDGFTAEELGTYQRHVSELVLEAREDVLIAPRPELFRFHRLDVISASGEVLNGSTEDTALGACVERDDPALSSSWFIRAFGDWAALVTNVPQYDALVLIVNSRFGRANAALNLASSPSRALPQERMVRISLADDAAVLTHEFGHAVFGLADEYVDSEEARFEPDYAHLTLEPLFQFPNVSTDPTGAKWAGLVDGAEPGGLRYGRGVYHPTEACRMGSSSDGDFCPVCQAAIDRVLAAVHEDWNDGPPLCGLASLQRPDHVAGALTLSVLGVDLNGARLEDVVVDGQSLFPPCAPCSRDQPQVGLGPIQARTATEAACLIRCAKLDGLLFDTTTIAPEFIPAGTHTVEVRCSDADGLEATAQVEILVP